MEEYTYRFLTIENLNELNTLFSIVFNTESKKYFIKWKYFENPVADAFLAGAYYDKKLVGSGAMIPEKMQIFNKEETIFKCTDLMTHPEHQRKGISKKINEMLKIKIESLHTSFSYTLCSKISTKSFIKNKWKYISEVKNYFKPYSFLRVQFLFKNVDRKSITFFDSVGNILDDYKFKNRKDIIGLNKSASFIKWRVSNPNFTYKLICHFNDTNQLDGYLIYSISDNNLLNIIDIDAFNNEKNIIDNLLLNAEYRVIEGKYKGVLIVSIKDSLLHKIIISKKYLTNPFNKGPLKTILDFNICQHEMIDSKLENTQYWNIYALNYDDI